MIAQAVRSIRTSGATLQALSTRTVAGRHSRATQSRRRIEYAAATAALVVEVADSSLRLDRRFKAALYAQAGVAVSTGS